MAIQQRKVKWGIIGPGFIATQFAAGLAESEHGELVAIASRNPGNPKLRDNFPGVRVLDGYEAMLVDAEVEAVYVATPHPGHAEWSIKCAEAGKHVLCEKPMGLSAFEADAMFHAAGKAGTFMGEAFMYRLHPQTRKLIDLIGSGRIGEVRKIQSSFGFSIPFNPMHRLLANDLAGGGILDVGCYPASMARLIAGVASGGDFLEPEKVSGMAHLGKTGVDEWASALLEFPNGIIAEISCAVSVNLDNVLRIYGTKGRIEVKDFWFAGFRSGKIGVIHVLPTDGEPEDVVTPEDRHLYFFEADAASRAILAGRREFEAPGMAWDDTLGNLRVLDTWRRDSGLVYDIEKPARRTQTLKGEDLRFGPDTIEHVQVHGLARPTSPVALGFEFYPDFAAAAIMLDAFYERGGNLFDTAHIYQSGKTETHFGQWHTSRGLDRNSFVLIGKGAHSPLTYPDVIAPELTASLDRLQTDHVDLYFMHRDNLDVPVGEFVDAMDDEVRKGRIRGLFGGSNWTRERLQEAIDYARANGKTAPGALSNNFALADMIQPIWAGCIAASDPAFRAWLHETRMPNFAWSSQARGFFTDAAGPDKRDNAELVHTWYSDANFARRERAIMLAAELGVTPIQIALAYVLAQPFPVVPLIGPRRLVELDSSLAALKIKLTPQQVKWLESGDRN